MMPRMPDNFGSSVYAARMEQNRQKIANMKPGWRIRVIRGPNAPDRLGVPVTCEGVISEVNELSFRIGVDPYPEEIAEYEYAVQDGTLELEPPTGHSYLIPFSAFDEASDCGVEVLDTAGEVRVEHVEALKVRPEATGFKPALTIHLPMTAMHLAKVLAMVDDVWSDDAVLDRDEHGDILVIPI